MKIKITEIEATSEELRASNTIADGLLMTLRRAFNPSITIVDDDDTDDDDTDDDGNG